MKTRGSITEAKSEGEDPEGPKKSQGYIAHIATRAIILIEANVPSIGLMVVMPIGMVEVSSFVIHPQIEPGGTVKKGEELGYFQFGGSSHCLIFRPGVVEEFALVAMPEPENPDAPIVLVGAKIASAHS